MGNGSLATHMKAGYVYNQHSCKSGSAPNITHSPEPGGEIIKLPSCCIDSMKNNV